MNETKPKRQRKTHKRQYPAVRIKSAKGKMLLASQVLASRRKNQEYKTLVDAGFWADWKPRRDFGVYATGPSTYSHNGIQKFL